MKKVELKVNHLEKTEEREIYQGRDITYISQYLKTLGIKDEDVPCFIDKPRDEDEDNPYDLDNMAEAVNTAAEMLNKGCHIYVQVDSDTDGYTSSSILINYIKRRYPEVRITYDLHKGKEHGVEVDHVPADVDLVFIPDAGSNQFKEQKELVAQGKTVIILDHHEVTDYEFTGAIVVNNQMSDRFGNKYLSGAGIVYMFIQALDEKYHADEDPIYRDYLDLTAIGIIADAMNMTTLGNNYIAYYGLNNIYNKFIQELAIKQSRGIKDPNHLTKIDVAFYIAPVINGVIRSGAPEDKKAVFDALITADDPTDYTREWRGTTYHENRWEQAVRLALNAKGRQDAAKKKSFQWLCEDIEKNGWDKDNLIIATLDEKESAKVSPNITGLIAMELVKHYNKPALVLRKTEFDGKEVYGGSGRNGNFFGLPDLKSVLADAGGYYQEGHANAFGSFLLPDQIQDVRNYFNTNLNSANFTDSVYEVDYWFDQSGGLDLDMLFELASYDNLWGNSLPQPKIAADVVFSSFNIMFMGKNKDSVKIKVGDVDFVAFKDEALVAALEKNPNGQAIIVGRPQLNTWMGKSNIQIMIDDIQIVPTVQVSSAMDLI